MRLACIVLFVIRVIVGGVAFVLIRIFRTNIDIALIFAQNCEFEKKGYIGFESSQENLRRVLSIQTPVSCKNFP